MASESTLKEMLLNAPPYVLRLMIGFLAACVIGSLAILVYPGTSGVLKEFRDVAAGVFTITLPLLPLVIGVVSAASGSTKRIDQLVAEFLHKTIPQKLKAYIDFEKHKTDSPTVIFDRMENVTKDVYKAPSAKDVSFCLYRLYYKDSDKERYFDVTIKMNVFNFEIICPIIFCEKKLRWLTGVERKLVWELKPILIEDADKLKEGVIPCYVLAATATLHGSLREGYAVSVLASKTNKGDLKVVYGFRQKLAENFLGSPYLRRYFAEDACIAVICLFNELLASNLKEAVMGSSTEWCD